jgi:hypothetical protein
VAAVVFTLLDAPFWPARRSAERGLAAAGADRTGDRAVEPTHAPSTPGAAP